jgi:hypothetical protein
MIPNAPLQPAAADGLLFAHFFGAFCSCHAEQGATTLEAMRIGKPLMIGTTTLGVALGLYEGYHFAGGLVVLMAALMGLIGVAMGTVIATVRRERKAEEHAARARDDESGSGGGELP